MSEIKRQYGYNVHLPFLLTFHIHLSIRKTDNVLLIETGEKSHICFTYTAELVR